MCLGSPTTNRCGGQSGPYIPPVEVHEAPGESATHERARGRSSAPLLSRKESVSLAVDRDATLRKHHGALAGKRKVCRPLPWSVTAATLHLKERRLLAYDSRKRTVQNILTAATASVPNIFRFTLGDTTQQSVFTPAPNGYRRVVLWPPTRDRSGRVKRDLV
jgi:hypothetical protein